VKFIKLQSLHGKPVYLNPEKIMGFGENERDGCTYIILGDDLSVNCKESPEHIVALIKEMEQ